MSSTSDRSRGQALAIFALSLTAVLLAAALAFDTGEVLLERRDEQNAVDAAAMAGVRYITTSDSMARSAARQIATDNGFTDGVDSQVVEVNIPPHGGRFAGFRNAIEVRTANVRPSIFAGIAGILDWDISARAVAAMWDGESGPWSILQTDPDACPGIFVGGNGGSVEAYGTIHANATCDQGLQRQGGGSMSVYAEDGAVCEVAGGYQDGGGTGTFDCSDNDPPDPITGAMVIEVDWLMPPDPPDLAPPPVQVGGDTTYPQPPAGCPGSSAPATVDAPASCQFQSRYAGSTWVLSPGLYPGGIKLQAGTYYLLPGLYYLGGGGLVITGNGTWTYSVESDSPEDFPPFVPAVEDDGTGTGGTVPRVEGGVLFFNTQLPNPELSTAAASELGQIRLNGATANVYLAEYDAELVESGDPNYDGVVMYQDERFSIAGDEIVLNGSDSNSVVRGTIYAPSGDVMLDGNGGTLTLDQVIGATFKANGNGGNLVALDSEDHEKLFYAAGLVE